MRRATDALYRISLHAGAVISSLRASGLQILRLHSKIDKGLPCGRSDKPKKVTPIAPSESLTDDGKVRHPLVFECQRSCENPVFEQSEPWKRGWVRGFYGLSIDESQSDYGRDCKELREGFERGCAAWALRLPRPNANSTGS